MLLFSWIFVFIQVEDVDVLFFLVCLSNLRGLITSESKESQTCRHRVVSRATWEQDKKSIWRRFKELSTEHQPPIPSAQINGRWRMRSRWWHAESDQRGEVPWWWESRTVNKIGQEVRRDLLLIVVFAQKMKKWAFKWIRTKKRAGEWSKIQGNNHQQQQDSEAAFC
jgi:hypothetical protein